MLLRRKTRQVIRYGLPMHRAVSSTCMDRSISTSRDGERAMALQAVGVMLQSWRDGERVGAIELASAMKAVHAAD